MAKDLFSGQSDLYAKYRPTYPRELFDYIVSFVNNMDVAWDCATGNGQAARELANYFTVVKATDISEAQLSKAIQLPNVRYYCCPADNTPFSENTFDLVTIATAYHWLNWKTFKTEITRVAKDKAVIAVWAYNLIDPEDGFINEIIQYFYFDVVYSCWDQGRRYVEDSYARVEFDYEPLPTKEFRIDVNWSEEQLKGYLKSWSAVQTYIKQNNASPLSFIEEDLHKAWGKEEHKKFHFPLFLKLGRVRK
jgi:ubiquinone/menaquinone biosynthesis C-methylase UbiE